MKIHFVNMPFGDLRIPSIALTQLKAVTHSAHGDKVSMRISYLNHEFGRLLGVPLYEYLANSSQGHASGLGEWLFRGAAFPDQPDNKAAYLTRYPLERAVRADFDAKLAPLRTRLNEFLDELIARYRIQEADVVGLTSMFLQNLPSIALARRLRQINARQTIVMGGANCEGSMGTELASNVPVLDFVFSGHALISFPQLVGHILAGTPDECHRIDGVFSRKNCRSLAALVDDEQAIDWAKIRPESQLNGVAALGREQNINATPELDYDGFLISLSHLVPEVRKDSRIVFETSRGCWWGERAHCTFCGLNGGTMAYRAMHPDRAIAFIDKLFDRYASQVSYFDSVDNILPREYLDQVLPRWHAPEHVSIFYEVKADLTRDQVKTLALGKVSRIQPGIEALATSTLKLMRKGTTVFHGLQLLSACKMHSVTPIWNLLVGFPGEQAEIYARYTKLLPSLFHLPPPSGVYPVRFDRFSPYFLCEKQYGLRLAPFDYYALCYPFPAIALRNMAYYFQDLNHESSYLTSLSEWLTPMREQVDRWQALWMNLTDAPRLQLQRESAGAYIHDSRSGTVREYWLDALEIELLQRISDPIREQEIDDHFGGSLLKFEQRNLVFRERGRVTSLVTPYLASNETASAAVAGPVGAVDPI